MSRGRHRHSPPLHRILPPSAVVGVSVLCAGGAWLLAEPLILRGLVAAAAAAAVTGAYLMRSWDRDAGRRLAELTRARAGDEWRAEERMAELEADLEESRELRARLETKLRRKRVELANLRGEHAALLRRYANAETERASALEGRRQLALEAATPRELPAARSTPTAKPPICAPPGRWRTSRAAGPSRRRAVPPSRPGSGISRSAPGRRRSGRGSTRRPRTRPEHSTSARRPPFRRPGRPPRCPRRAPSPAASPIAPHAALRRHPVPQGSFDFFGTQKARAAIESVQNEDLADVVGEEALAAHRTGTTGNRAVGKVIDLTAHDETEQLDVVELRSAIS